MIKFLSQLILSLLLAFSLILLPFKPAYAQPQAEHLADAVQEIEFLDAMRSSLAFWKQLFLLTLTAVLAILFFFPNYAEASIRKTEEADGQILYQSRHQLQDTQQQSWQVVLFKREKEESPSDVKLRLVGFPGKVEIDHPQPLVIENRLQAWQAEDLFAEKSPAPNVGQYNVTQIISQLSQEDDVLLKIPETNGENINLTVPGVIILEWKIVAGEN